MMRRIESRKEQLERRISICHENIAYFARNIERNINSQFAQYRINWYNNTITALSLSTTSLDCRCHDVPKTSFNEAQESGRGDEDHRSTQQAVNSF
jgi:hypothetical protein